MHYRQGDDPFPLLYHSHHQRHSEDLPFWLELAAECGPRVLELGCGSGRVLLPLAAAGAQVTGLDIDAAMLRFLRSQLSERLAGQVQLLQADLQAFHLARAFDLILLPCNTFSTLSPATRQAMLACASRHLRPGGLFATSMPNPELLRNLPRLGKEEMEEEFLHPVDHAPVQVSSAWERDPQAFRVTWHYDHLQPDGTWLRTSTQIIHLLENKAVYLEEIAQAGLQVQATYGGYDRTPFHRKNAEQLILVAQKPGI